MIFSSLGALFRVWHKFETLCLSKYWARKFNHAGANISIGSDFNCYKPECVHIDDGVVIANGVTIRAVTTYPWGNQQQSFSPSISLMKGCFINNRTHITATTGVTIGDEVMIAENCFISDHTHSHEDPHSSVMRQPLASNGPLTIGSGSWIGENCTIVGALSIGKHTVVGSNSVVTSDLPDHCVAVGAPARIIRLWDADSNSWRKHVPLDDSLP